MGILLWVLPLAAIALMALLPSGRAQHIVSTAAAALMLGAAGHVTQRVMTDGACGYVLAGGLFYVDSVSAVMLDIMVFIVFMTAVYSIGYLQTEQSRGHVSKRAMKRYYILMYAFIFTMILALTVRNMGAMWIAIEATTLASAFLVGFHNDKPALEAAWKYVIICSVGISIALLGVIFLYISSSGILHEAEGLDWTALYMQAEALHTPALRLAFIFVLIGFGTKAGLAPMHTWLPDAHSQAPSPISALLSGVLLNSAMYAIIRTVAIVNKNFGDSAFTGGLLIVAGLASIVTAAFFILTQKDYKRLLAYSSIEHMGIISFSIGLFTPASLFAAFFHMINHSLTKSMLFLSSGGILQKYGTTRADGVRDVLRTLPVSGAVFLLGLFAIGGMPPFGVFASELTVLSAFFEAGSDAGMPRLLAGGAAALLLAIIFAGIVYSLLGMFHSRDESNTAGIKWGETNIAGACVLLIMLAVAAVMGITMPDELKNLISDAAKIVGGGAG